MCDTRRQCRMSVLLVFHQSSYAAAAAPNTDGRGTEKTPHARSTKAGQGPRKSRSRGTEARPPFYSWWGTSCSRLTAATLPVSSCGSGCVTWEHTYGIARQRVPRPRTPPRPPTRMPRRAFLSRSFRGSGEEGRQRAGHHQEPRYPRQGRVRAHRPTRGFLPQAGAWYTRSTARDAPPHLICPKCRLWGRKQRQIMIP